MGDGRRQSQGTLDTRCRVARPRLAGSAQPEPRRSGSAPPPGRRARDPAREFFLRSARENLALATSAEVLQELLHAYLPGDRTRTLDAALRLAEGRIGTVWAVEEDDVRFARLLADEHPGLRARELLHLASCRRRDVTRVKTYDRALASMFD